MWPSHVRTTAPASAHFLFPPCLPCGRWTPSTSTRPSELPVGSLRKNNACPSLPSPAVLGGRADPRPAMPPLLLRRGAAGTQLALQCSSHLAGRQSCWQLPQSSTPWVSIAAFQTAGPGKSGPAFSPRLASSFLFVLVLSSPTPLGSFAILVLTRLQPPDNTLRRHTGSCVTPH